MRQELKSPEKQTVPKYPIPTPLEMLEEIECMFRLYRPSPLYKKLPSIHKTLVSVIAANKLSENRFRFRAECITDISRFLMNQQLGDRLRSVKITALLFPDCEVEIEALTTLEELRKALSREPNSHVMVQSLNHAAEYTGERWYQPGS